MTTKRVADMTPDEVVAMRAYKRDWARRDYAKDPERGRAAAKLYAKRHPDLVKARQAKWDAAHRDRKRELWATWYAKNAERVSAKGRARTEAEREVRRIRVRQWFKDHPEKNRAYAHERRSRTGGKYTVQEWQALLVKYDSRCAYCGTDGFMSVDHRTPLIRGGTNNIDNILPACLSCNKRKNRRTEEEFRHLISHRDSHS